MWVRSQNKKSLLEITSFNIERNYGGKKKIAITGSFGSLNVFHFNIKILGLYKSEDEAINEMNKIEGF